MKNLKSLILVAMTISFDLAHAQVGINTVNPQATLDVAGKPTTPLSLDGVIPPRLTGDQLRAKTYTTAQTGAVVYVTAADSAPAGQTVNVTVPGFYYFNGTVWGTMTINNIPNGTGNILAINGQPQIAQEVSARMDGDFTVPTNPASPTRIGRMTEKLVDNFNTFTGTATNNAFTVNSNGTYLVNMNFSLQGESPTTPLSGNCYYGLYNVTDNKYVAFNIDTITSLAFGQVTNLSYQVAMELVTGKTYAFTIEQQHNGGGSPSVVMRGTGTTAGGGIFPMTFFSVIRIK